MPQSNGHDPLIEPETRYFFELTPERVLRAVEQNGVRCTGRCLTLNSMENRVYEVEIEIEDETSIRSPSERFRVVKFYRPGRWTPEQIGEEHQFLMDLAAAEIPVVAPLQFSDGTTLRRDEATDIYYAIFPKQGGRSPDELQVDQASWIGRLLARMHAIGETRAAPHRLRLTPEVYGLSNLSYLLENRVIPPEFEANYARTVEEICRLSQPLFVDATVQRIHGDCHLGNVLWGSEGPFLVDFDDMVVGPPVQDIWLLTPGRDEYAASARSLLLEGYEQMRSFDYSSLRLVEPLRALRFVHFSAWIARRWQDPAFKRTFDRFGTASYWHEQLTDLAEQLELIRDGL